MDPNFTARLTLLESQVRRWKLITVLLLASLAVALLTAFAPAQGSQKKYELPFDQGMLQQVPSNRLMAHDFLLIGKDGGISARLTAKHGAAVLEFYDDKGT